MTPADKLRAARALIEDPERWTTGVLARSAKGRSVSPYGRAAVAWCAFGAADRVRLGSPHYLHRAVTTWSCNGLGDVNDRLGHAAVLQVYDRAIELAEAEA